jgi:mxaJ protein
MTRLVLLCALVSVARAEPARLRVCADPNNLPFSNAAGAGLENRLAELIATELRATVEYTWWAQRRGFFRNTLKAERCDVVLGVPADLGLVAATRPYYRSVYALVFRRDGAHRPGSLDDPALRKARIGVPLAGDDGANPPPAHALAARGIVDNVVGYSLYGDHARAMPAAGPLRALSRGEVDVAIVWGPLAGWYAKSIDPRLEVVPLGAGTDKSGQPLGFDIAVGVRRGDRALRDAIDAALARRRHAIDELLAEFGVPRR